MDGDSYLTVNSSRLYQLFKYAVYALLTLNIYLFFVEEYAAAPLRFPDGVGLAHIRDAYAATIDTAAWVVLLLMFELETYVLEDKHFSKGVTLTLHGLRFACFAIIKAVLLRNAWWITQKKTLIHPTIRLKSVPFRYRGLSGFLVAPARHGGSRRGLLHGPLHGFEG